MLQVIGVMAVSASSGVEYHGSPFLFNDVWWKT
jgi:hypothetical protein